MPPTRKQQDRFLGHDPVWCTATADQPSCGCQTWECRDCGQPFNEDEGHDCPAVPKHGCVMDPRD